MYKISQKDMEVKYASAKEIWADINTKPLQGQLFSEMRAKQVGIAVDYDDDQERRRTHPMLLPRVDQEGVIPKSDVEVLRKASGISRKRSPVESTPRGSKAPVGRRSVLDGLKYGPGPRPVWKDTGTLRFPNWSRALAASC